MCVDSTHYVSHRRKHHHIARSACGLYIRQDERLRFHASRITDTPE